MKNPVVIFVGAALITLAALVGVSSSRWQNWPKPSEILSEAPKSEPAKQEAKVAVQQAPAAKSDEPAAVDDTRVGDKPAQKQEAAEEKAQQQAAVDPNAAVEQPKQPEAPQQSVKRGEKGGTFDVVRIDVNGEAVFAGRCDPGATVALLVDDKVVGSAKANAEGEWLIVPEAPLSPGNHEVTIESTNPNGRKWLSQQQLAVSIEAGKKPLIVLSEANLPSRVLQKPDEQVAVAQTEPQAEQPPAAAEQEGTPSKAETAPETAAGEKQQAEPAAEAETQKTEERATAKSAVEPQSPSTSEPKAETPKAEAPAEQSADEKVAAVDPQAADEQSAATKTPPPAAEEPRTPDIGLSLDTVDYNDKGDIIFSGKVEAGSAVRLYVDNRHVGDAIADDAGSWTFAGREQIAPGAHNLRADVVDSAGKVSQRIELPFMRADPNQVAALQDDRKQEPQVTSEAETPTAPQPETVPTSPQAETPQSETPTAEKPATEEQRTGDQQSAAAEQPKPGTRATAEVEIAQPGKQAPETSASQQPQQQATQESEQPALPEAQVDKPARTSQPEPDQQTPQPPSQSTDNDQQPQTGQSQTSEQQTTQQQKVESSTTPEAQGEAQTSTKQDQQAAVTSDEPSDAAEAMPKKGRVVIQPGNSLWRISRVIYGRGLQYTTIYEANKDQIRNPHRIYPGQIFATPDVVPPELIDPKRRLPLTAEELNANR